MALRWYVIRTEPRGEHLAAELRRDGFEALLPRAKSINPRFRHTDTSLPPVYAFFRCAPQDGGCLTFRSVHRASGWARFGGQIRSDPDAVVLERIARLETINRPGCPSHRFRSGDKVRIVSDSIKSLAKVVEAARSPDRKVKVLLNFRGGMVSPQVSWQCLWLAKNRAANRVRALRRSRGRGRWIQDFQPPESVDIGLREAYT